MRGTESWTVGTSGKLLSGNKPWKSLPIQNSPDLVRLPRSAFQPREAAPIGPPCPYFLSAVSLSSRAARRLFAIEKSHEYDGGRYPGRS